MPNHASAEKRVRRNGRRNELNTARRSRIRTFLRKAREAIVGSAGEVTVTAVRAAESEIQRGVSKGVFHKNKASRLISRMAQAAKKAASSAS